jgi:hypothetical protein
LRAGQLHAIARVAAKTDGSLRELDNRFGFCGSHSVFRFNSKAKVA